MNRLDQLLRGVSAGDLISHGRLSVMPLFRPSTQSFEYVTLDDDDARRNVRIEEVSRHGSVSRLLVRNRTQRTLFIPDGMLFLGVYQNRVANASVLVSPGSEMEIPVSCVERGRWEPLSAMASAGVVADPRLRSLLCEQSTQSLRRGRGVQADQAEVWSHVDAALESAASSSATSSYEAAWAPIHAEVDACLASLPLPPEACGVAVAVDGKPVALDLFDNPRTLSRLWPRLLKGYLVREESVAAAQPGGRRGSSERPIVLLARARDATVEEHCEAGTTTLRFSSEGVAGAALLVDGEILHLALFPRRPAAARPAVSSSAMSASWPFTSSYGMRTDRPTRRHRSWWWPWK